LTRPSATRFSPSVLERDLIDLRAGADPAELDGLRRRPAEQHRDHRPEQHAGDGQEQPAAEGDEAEGAEREHDHADRQRERHAEADVERALLRTEPETSQIVRTIANATQMRLVWWSTRSTASLTAR
jgi:hypothetical protein